MLPVPFTFYAPPNCYWGINNALHDDLCTLCYNLFLLCPTTICYRQAVSNYLSNTSSRILKIEHSKWIEYYFSNQKSKIPNIGNGEKDIISTSEKIFYVPADNEGIIYWWWILQDWRRSYYRWRRILHHFRT